MYTEQQINEWKSKAEKWDALGKQIEKCYVIEDENGEFVENDDENIDLGTIGEIAAIHFGWV